MPSIPWPWSLRYARPRLSLRRPRRSSRTQRDGGAAANPHHNRRHHKADTGQCRAGAGRRPSIGRARTGELDQGDRATGLCTDQGRFRRRRHCGGRRSRTGGLSWPKCRDSCEAGHQGGGGRYRGGFPGAVEIGLPFTVGLQLLPAVQVEGKVREIAPQADPVTRMRRVRIALNDPPESFRLGTTVTASSATAKSSLRVPASAVLAKDGANFVWVVDLLRTPCRCTRSISPGTKAASASPAVLLPARAS